MGRMGGFLGLVGSNFGVVSPMIVIRPLAAILLLACSASLAPPAHASLLLSPDGSTVADSQCVT